MPDMSLDALKRTQAAASGQSNLKHPGFRLIVGLKNPGDAYAKTRHNAGAWWLEALADAYHLRFTEQKKLQGWTARLELPGIDCWFLLPSVFMNCSGQSVQAMASFYKIPPEQILVAHDELDLQAGVLRFKQAGGHGGHNGLRDIIAKLGPNFWRCRIGISHPGDASLVTNHVLHAPSGPERLAIETAITSSLHWKSEIITGDMQKVMGACHSA